MKIFTKDEFLKDIDSHITHLSYGSVFIYPTDTLYGLGCDARNNALVQRIRRIKNSYGNPMSVIAPSKDWIKTNCVVKPEHEGWLKKLPGPYTLIFERKCKDCIADDVNPKNNTLGVRIPNNWFADVVKKLDFPVITTSINVHGQEPCKSIAEVPANMGHMVDIGIDEGIIKGKPSTLVDLTGTEPKVIER